MPAKLAELLDAFEFANIDGGAETQAYVCRDTGKTYLVSDYVDVDEELPPDLESSDRYVPVPHKNDLDLGRDLVFRFAEQEMPDDFEDVRDIFHRKGAYRRYKDLLHSRDMTDKWYAFEQAATEQALREWCEQEGIELTED